MTDLGAEKPYAIAVEELKTVPVATAPVGILTGNWEVGLCSCCTHCVPNCLMVSCCPCVSLAQVSARLGMMQYGLALILAILVVWLTGGLGFAFWVCQARTVTRERFKIPGSCCDDYCAACWCGCCALAQVATHIKSYKPGSCSFFAQDTLPAYTRT